MKWAWAEQEGGTDERELNFVSMSRRSAMSSPRSTLSGPALHESYRDLLSENTEMAAELGRAREVVDEDGEEVERKVEWEVPVDRTCYLGGEEERTEMEGGQLKKVKVSVPGLHTNFAWEEDLPEEKLVTDSTVSELVAENERQLREMHPQMRFFMSKRASSFSSG